MPFCFRGCCWSYGTSQHVGKLALVHEFPEWRSHKAQYMAAGMTSTAAEWDFREGLRQSLGFGMSPPQQRVVTWLLSANGTNQRRVADEDALVARVRNALPHGWSLRTLNPTFTAYLTEMRTIASSAVIVSLFGSALHNMRVMVPNSTVVEIHAALKQDYDKPTDWMYYKLARRLGIRWAGFAPDGFRPLLVNITTSSGGVKQDWKYRKVDGVSMGRTAFVDATSFVGFFRRVLAAHDSSTVAHFDALKKEYTERVNAHQDPWTLLKKRKKERKAAAAALVVQTAHETA